MPPTVFQIFVSSTWEDLQPERGCVERALQRMREAKFVGMEYFGSRDTNTRDASLIEVDRSQVYVGIFAGRYGSGITEAEYRRARELKLPCFIYFKRSAVIPEGGRDGDAERRARLQALKDELKKVHTVTEFDEPDELALQVTQQLYRWLIDERLTVADDAAYAVGRPTHAAGHEHARGLAILRDRVKQAWVEGVLDGSVHAAARQELGKHAMPEAVEHPWAQILELPGKSSEMLAASTTMRDTFERAGRSLLILGQPGSGKTITLLELARDLIGLAERDGAQPVPVVVSLSTWTNPSLDLMDWLLGEIQSKYFIPRSLSRPWIEELRLLPLLDGLDEVASGRRADCVYAINRFVELHGVPGIAVCCRMGEYLALSRRLRLHAAICLEPLTSEQLDTQLQAGGSALGALREALLADPELRSLASSPLMFSVMSLTYAGEEAIALNAAERADSTPLQARLFQAYVQRMFQRRGQRAANYSPDAMSRWLHELALRMRQHSLTVFMIEQLQPSWLARAWERMLYAVLSRLGIALILGIGMGALWLLLWVALIQRDDPSLNWLIEAAVGIAVAAFNGCVAGVIEGVRFARQPDAIAASTTRPPRAIAVSLLFGVIWCVTWTLFLGGLEGVMTGILGGILFALLLRAQADPYAAGNDIRTVDALGWSWKKALIGALLGVGWFVVWTFVAGVFKVISMGQLTDLEVAFAVCWVIAMLGPPAGFIVGGLRSKITDIKVKPNQGIVTTARNAVTAALIVALASGILLARLLGWSGSLLLGPFFVLLAFLHYGGIDIIKHYVLRLIVWLSGQGPRSYARFLDQAVGFVLMQRAGAGYVFIHALLLAYFARREEATSAYSPQ